jgi:hypothetical protein
LHDTALGLSDTAADMCAIDFHFAGTTIAEVGLNDIVYALKKQ